MKKRNLPVFVVMLVAVVLLFAVKAHAYRPFITDDAEMTGKGGSSVELSWDHVEWDNVGSFEGFLFVPTYGITDKLDVWVEVPYLRVDPDGVGSESGLGDINIAAKLLISEGGDDRPALAVKALVKTQTGDEDKGLGSGDEDYNLTLATTKAFGEHKLNAMLGYTFVGDNGDSNIRNIFSYGAAWSWNFAEKMHLAAEVFGCGHPDKTAQHDPASALIGGFYEFSDRLVLDAGIRFGLNNDTPDWNTTVGMAYSY